jgi:5-methylcytosine-specific restriction endonuclease McrA
MEAWGLDYDQRTAHIKREKAKAKILRKSPWWSSKVGQEGKCFYCQVELNLSLATLDHVVPLSRGGETKKGNVVVSCKDCNTKKADATAVELLLLQLDS